MSQINLNAELKSDHVLHLSVPEDFPTGPVRVTLESISGLSETAANTDASTDFAQWLADLHQMAGSVPTIPLDQLRRENLYED